MNPKKCYQTVRLYNFVRKLIYARYIVFSNEIHTKMSNLHSCRYKKSPPLSLRMMAKKFTDFLKIKLAKAAIIWTLQSKVLKKYINSPLIQTGGIMELIMIEKCK